MGNTSIEHLRKVLNEPLNIDLLIKVCLKVDAVKLPNLLKKKIYHLDNCLNEWQQCSKQLHQLSYQLKKIERKSQLANKQAEYFSYQLNHSQDLEEILTRVKSIQIKENENIRMVPINTWQQKKKYLQVCKQILESHLKLLKQNELVERYHQLPKYTANLLCFGIQTNKRVTLKKISELLIHHQARLENNQKKLKSLRWLSLVYTLHEAHQEFVDKINVVGKKLNDYRVECNFIDGELAELQPIVDKYPSAFKQAKDDFGSVVGVNHYFSSFLRTSLIKCNLLDKSLIKFLSIQKYLHKYLNLCEKKNKLVNDTKQTSDIISGYVKKLEEFKEKLSKKGVIDFSSYGLLEKIKTELEIIDPEINYRNINKLKIKQRIELLNQTIPKENKELEMIIPNLQSLEKELADIRHLRHQYTITATNDELAEGYPWQSEQTLTKNTASNLIHYLSEGLERIEALCWYEGIVRKNQEIIQKNEEISENLKKAINHKQTALIRIERSIGKSKIACQNLFQKVAHDLENKNDKNTSFIDDDKRSRHLTSSNLWENFLWPLIKVQPDELQLWLKDCCQIENKNVLTNEQQLQFEQLCRDIYIELKYIKESDDKILLAYKDMFSEPKGLEKLLGLKQAISIDSQNKLFSLKNKELKQALLQFKLLARQEKGKIKEVLEQVCNQLHYIALQGEKRGISEGLIKKLQRQFDDDPRYFCLRKSRNYDSILDWLYGICQIIKLLFVRPVNLSYKYGLFSKQPVFMEQATNIGEVIAAKA